MPKAIKEACIYEMWCQTKITNFWKMRQNLGEPKTSAGFEEIEEDELLVIIGIKSIQLYYMILAVAVIVIFKDRRTLSLMMTFKVLRILGQPGAKILLNFK